ncbi:MAG TPA: response regulator [Fibrobacteria bacterium]|nr:response regulator [Fibrobacteria bacterium]
MMDRTRERQPDSILLVDDEEPIRKLMRVILEPKGFRILEAASSDQALGILEVHGVRIQLVVTDIQMPPGMDGVDLVESVRRRRPDLPVVFISGYSHQYGRLSTVIDQERTWFLQKPFSPYQLFEAVKLAI